MSEFELFRVHFVHDGYKQVKGVIAGSPDQARKSVKAEYPGAIVTKVKVDRDAEQVFKSVYVPEID